MLRHYVWSYTVVAGWFYFVIPPKNVKNVINRFYRSELKNRCSFVVYCLLSAGKRSIIFRVIPYIRFVIEFKGVRNNLLEISVIYNDISIYFGDVIVVI